MSVAATQMRTVIRLVGRTDGAHELRWGRLVLPRRVDLGLVRLVGRFYRGTTLVRGRSTSGKTAVVAIFKAA